ATFMSVNPALGRPDPVAQRGLQKCMLHETVHESKAVDKCYTPPPRDHQKDFRRRCKLLEKKSLTKVPTDGDKSIAKIIRFQ
ncbi:hypothetical protein AAVH_30010, partial [Aphelenchoides avenae]